MFTKERGGGGREWARSMEKWKGISISKGIHFGRSTAELEIPHTPTFCHINTPADDVHTVSMLHKTQHDQRMSQSIIELLKTFLIVLRHKQNDYVHVLYSQSNLWQKISLVSKHIKIISGKNSHRKQTLKKMKKDKQKEWLKLGNNKYSSNVLIFLAFVKSVLKLFYWYTPGTVHLKRRHNITDMNQQWCLV